MRIAFIAGGFPLISETFILNQITALIDQGHTVDIFARRRGPTSPVHADVIAYKLLERTHWFELPKSRLARLARAGGTFLAGLSTYPRATLRCVSMNRYRSLYHVLNNLMHVRPFLRGQYDVVMCHFGTNGIDFVFLKDVLPKMGFVTMFHRGDILHADEVGPEVYDRLRAKGDAFLAIGETWHRPMLRQIGFDNTKIVSLPIGVDLRQIPYRPRTQAGAELDILTVARLEREKGLDVGLQAVKHLISTNPTTRIRYRIVGEGSERSNLTALRDRLGLAAIVEFLGAQPTAEVVRWMHASHVFMLPSRTEGTPTVLLEAQASGMPVLATNVGGVVDIVGDGRSGFVVRSEDADALTERLQYLLDHPETWATLGRQGRDFVEEHHDIAKLGRRLAALCEAVASDLRRSHRSGSTSASLADSARGLPGRER